MRVPKFLKKGDKIGLVCTARGFTVEELKPTLALINTWGYEAVLGQTIGKSFNQYGGTDEERVKDFQNMLNDSSIRAIWICRGGYGTIRIMDKLDFTSFMNDPKWIMGYSDVTVLHNYLNHLLGFASVHATMPINIPTNSTESIDSLHKILRGEAVSYTLDNHPSNRLPKQEIKAPLIGGNLSILYSLLGTKTGFDTHNKILFIEDVGEYLYHMDRMMISLKNAQKLHTIKALLVGGMTDMNDNTTPFGKTTYEIILEHCQDFDYPVIFNVPAGHQEDNRALLLGADCTINLEKDLLSLSFNDHNLLS